MGTKVEFPMAPGHGGQMSRDAGPSPLRASCPRNNHGRHTSTRLLESTRRRPTHPLALLREVILGWAVLAAVFLAPSPAQAQRGGGRGTLSTPIDDGRITHIDVSQPLNAKQMKALMQSNFEKLKKDSAELASLAKQLREELDKPEPTTLSLEDMNRIERIEKLAKKIRDEMKGF